MAEILPRQLGADALRNSATISRAIPLPCSFTSLGLPPRVSLLSPCRSGQLAKVEVGAFPPAPEKYRPLALSGPGQVGEHLPATAGRTGRRSLGRGFVSVHARPPPTFHTFVVSELRNYESMECCKRSEERRVGKE